MIQLNNNITIKKTPILSSNKKTHRNNKLGGFKFLKKDLRTPEDKLLESLKTGNLNSRYVEKLLKNNKINVNIKDKQGKTPIHYCVERNSVSIFNLLKKYHPKYDLADREGKTPFFSACSYGNLEIIKLLLSVQADPNLPDNNGMTPFCIACFNDHFPVVHFLSQLKKKKNIISNNSNIESGSNIKDAITKLNFKYGEYLINFNKKDSHGMSAAHLTAMKGFDNIMIVLTNIFDMNGHPQVFLNEQNNLGETPCFLAAKFGHSNIIKVFVNLNTINKRKRINFSKENNDGCTPCFIAAENGHKNVISELSLIKIDMNIPESKYGQTPCFGACKQGHSKVLIELIKHGANIHLATPEETGAFSPLFIAVFNGNLEIAKILLLNGYYPKFKDFSSKNKVLIKKLIPWSEKQVELQETYQQLKKIEEFFNS